jgi:hypothetical protein
MEIIMSVYMVERNLKGIAMGDLAAAQMAAIAKADEMSRSGLPIRYIRSIFALEDGCCRCLFEASSRDQVQHLNDELKLPYETIVPALDLTP